MRELFAVVALFAVGLGLLFGAVIWWKGVQCEARWADFEHDWGIASGCRVKIDGRWTPEDRVREMKP